MNLLKNPDFRYWVSLGLLIVFMFFMFSDKEFSFIFTLSGTVQTFGFGLIVIKISKSRSVAGLSRETFVCYSIIFSLRAVLFMMFKGYLPYDSTGDFIFRAQQIIATLLSIYILYLISSTFKTSYNRDLDVVKAYYLIVVALIIAIIFHPNLNRNVLADYVWAFSQYLQTIALLPQFILFNKKGGEIQSYTSHFVAAQAISRILSLIFWIFTFTELNQTDSQLTYSVLPEYVGHWFLLAQIIHLLIMADFMYYWLRAIWRGKNVSLPTYI